MDFNSLKVLHIINKSSKEKEEVYKQLANIFVRMALKERENERK